MTLAMIEGAAIAMSIATGPSPLAMRAFILATAAGR